MPTIAQLNQRNPCSEPERIADLAALYEGGAAFKKRLDRFLLQREREPMSRYELRKKEFHYRNYIGPIVDYFASLLFTSRPQPVAKLEGQDDPVLDPGDYYNEFRDDCDRNGTDVDAFFKERLSKAMVEGRSWLRLHHPTSDTAPANKAEFERLKMGDVWLSRIDYDEVLDWECDEVGSLEWVIVHSKSAKRKGPGDERNTIVETWEFITTESVETFQITYDKRKPPSPKDEVPSLGVEPHRFGRVPVICIDFPSNLWVAGRLETPQLSHFRLSNGQSWSLTSTCYAMPVAKVKDPEEYKQSAMGAGYGIVLYTEESWEWEAPPADHFLALDTEIKACKDEIFRISHQMALGVENNASAVGRSAESKATDAQSTRVMLVAFAKRVKEEIARVYNAIAECRGDKFTWTIAGLDEFAASDLLGFLEALVIVQETGGIPSNTANTLIKQRVAEGLLPDLDQETKSTIAEEIKESVENAPDPEDAEIDRMVRLHTELAEIDGGATGAKPGRAGKAGGAKPPKTPGGGKRRVTPPTAKA